MTQVGGQIWRAALDDEDLDSSSPVKTASVASELAKLRSHALRVAEMQSMPTDDMLERLMQDYPERPTRVVASPRTTSVMVSPRNTRTALDIKGRRLSVADLAFGQALRQFVLTPRVSSLDIEFTPIQKGEKTPASAPTMSVPRLNLSGARLSEAADGERFVEQMAISLHILESCQIAVKGVARAARRSPISPRSPRSRSASPRRAAPNVITATGGSAALSAGEAADAVASAKALLSHGRASRTSEVRTRTRERLLKKAAQAEAESVAAASGPVRGRRMWPAKPTPRRVLHAPLHATDFTLRGDPHDTAPLAAIEQTLVPLLQPIGSDGRHHQLQLLWVRHFVSMQQMGHHGDPLLPPQARRGARAVVRSYGLAETTTSLAELLAHRPDASVRVVKADAAATLHMHRMRKLRPSIYKGVTPDAEKWDLASGWLAAIYRLYGDCLLLPLAAACRFEWAAHATTGNGPSPRQGTRQQLLLRVVTVAASRWLLGLVPTNVATSPQKLRPLVAANSGTSLLVEMLQLSALPWWAMRQAIADNDPDVIYFCAAHAFHQMRAAAQPIHAKACALQLAVGFGAAPEVQRLLRRLCSCPRAGFDRRRSERGGGGAADADDAAERTGGEQSGRSDGEATSDGETLGGDTEGEGEEDDDDDDDDDEEVGGAPGRGGRGGSGKGGGGGVRLVSEVELLDALDDFNPGTAGRAGAEAAALGAADFELACARVEDLLCSRLGSTLEAICFARDHNPFSGVATVGESPARRVEAVASGSVRGVPSWKTDATAWMAEMVLADTSRSID